MTSVKIKCAKPEVYTNTQRTLEYIFGIPQNIGASVKHFLGVKFECSEPAFFSNTQRTLETIFGIPQNIKACVEKFFF